MNKHIASGALAASLALVGFAGAALASPSPVQAPSAKRQRTRKFDRLRVLAVSVFGALAIGYAAPASAGLIGDSVHAERLTGSTVVNAKDFTVGAGVEFNDLFFGLDITDNAIDFMFPRANFGSIFLKLVGLRFIEDPSRPLDILSITPNLVFGPGSKPLTADDIRARLKLSGNDILFDMSDFVTGSTSTLAIALAPASPSAVPEPMSLALFGTAVPALLLARRARRRPR